VKGVGLEYAEGEKEVLFVAPGRQKLKEVRYVKK
jgi:hypothetical protein